MKTLDGRPSHGAASASIGNDVRAVPRDDGRPGVAELVRVPADAPPASNSHESGYAPNSHESGYAPNSHESGYVLCLSAKTPAALAALVAAYADALSRSDADAADITFTANTGRAHFEHRLAIVGATGDELAEKLAQHSADSPATGAADPARHDSPSTAPPPANGETIDPHELAELYMRGGAIDWQGVYRGQHRRRVSLPTYPFQRERYWLDRPGGRPSQVVDRGGWPSQAVPNELDAHSPDGLTTPRAAPLASNVHPLLGRRIRSASRDIIYESHLTPDSPPWLADHRVRGSEVLPATAYVELALAAARLSLPPSTVYCLPSTSLPQFLPLDTTGRLLQTILRPLADGEWQFGVYSASQAAGADADWVLHADGRISSALPHVEGPSITLDEARSLCGERLDVDEYYRALAARGLHYGPAFRGIVEIAAGPRRALAKAAPA